MCTSCTVNTRRCCFTLHTHPWHGTRSHADDVSLVHAVCTARTTLGLGTLTIQRNACRLLKPPGAHLLGLLVLLRAECVCKTHLSASRVHRRVAFAFGVRLAPAMPRWEAAADNPLYADHQVRVTFSHARCPCVVERGADEGVSGAELDDRGAAAHGIGKARARGGRTPERGQATLVDGHQHPVRLWIHPA